jgi:putative oxidoreductase
MSKLERCRLWLQAHDDLFIDLVRIYLGAGLFVKALYLLGHREYLTQVITDSGNGWFAPAALAQYVITAHLIGGALLAVGAATRIAAFVQLPILIGAVFYVYLPHMATVEPRQSLEYSALVAFLLFWLGVFGAGRWSVDYMISRKRVVTPDAATVVPKEAH